MIIAHLTRHWYARRHFPFHSWMACIVRSLRVLLFYRFHVRLLALEIYCNYVSRAHDDVFHHLSHRNYLLRGLTLRQRVHCVGVHYDFEQVTFNCAYKRAVYSHGLPLWVQEIDGTLFSIRLEMASRLSAEGDLTLCLRAGDTSLHSLSFSWTEGKFVGIETLIVPLVVRNQGHRADAATALDAFERAFPHNSPSYFCFCALQGVAQALGMHKVAAVKSLWQCSYTASANTHFVNAYDSFWQALGGVSAGTKIFHIALPFYVRPLSEMPSKHRKRAKMRREHWGSIAETARLKLIEHLADARRTALKVPELSPDATNLSRKGVT